MSGGRVVTLSPDQTQISTDKTSIAADGADVCTVYVTVKSTDETDGEANGMARLRGSAVVLAVTPSTGVTITQPTGTADAAGNITGSFVSTNATTVTVSATILGQSVASGGPVVVGGGGAPVDPPSGDPFFTEDFAGGVKTNDNGFTWNSTDSRVAVVLAPDASGDYALRLRFGPDADGADSSAEQRFNLGQDLGELWVEYSVWLPTNWAYRSQATGTNNKFFTIWNTAYGSGTATWQASFEYTRASNSAANIRPMSKTQYSTSVTSTPRTGWSNPDNGKAFIGGAGPIGLGAWHQIRIHMKAASAADVADGVIEMWIDGTLFAQATGVLRNFDDVGEPVLRNGYFFGWSNSGFTDETDFYIRGGTNGPKFYATDPGWT
jgi:hypothetical protein